MLAMVALVESGTTMSRTRPSVDCTFPSSSRTLRQTCSAAPTLDSRLVATDALPPLTSRSATTK
jgi:hypothetical protein